MSKLDSLKIWRSEMTQVIYAGYVDSSQPNTAREKVDVTAQVTALFPQSELLGLIETALRMAIKEGGNDARMHVGDLLAAIEGVKAGRGDGSGVTGPFYDTNGVQARSPSADTNQ